MLPSPPWCFHTSQSTGVSHPEFRKSSSEFSRKILEQINKNIWIPPIISNISRNIAKIQRGDKNMFCFLTVLSNVLCVCVCVCVCMYVEIYIYIYIYKVKVKWSHYRLGVAQRVGSGIALLFHDRGTRRGWVVSSTTRPHFTPGKEPVPILQEAGWAPGPVWTGGKSRPNRDSIPDRPARSQSLYRLSYPAHKLYIYSGSLQINFFAII